MPRGRKKKTEDTKTPNTYEAKSHGMSLDEQETIINFNKEEKIAYVFTYDKSWQKHIETKLKIQPHMVNGRGGKEYKVDKKLISKPRVPRTGEKRVLSPERKAQMIEILKKARGKKT